MTTELYKWKIYCNTDQKWEYKWGESHEHLVVCPSNSQHDININSNYYCEVLTNTVQKVEIKEEDGLTGGKYRNGGHFMNITSNGKSQIIFSHNYAISAAAVSYYTKDNNFGDRLHCLVADNTTVGVLTSNAITGNSIIDVCPITVSKINNGFDVSLIDESGNKYERLGEAMDVDTENNQITVSKAPTQTFYSNNTFVKMSVYTFKNHYLGGTGYNVIGTDKIGASYITKGIPITLIYENLNGITTDKHFLFNYGRLY